MLDSLTNNDGPDGSLYCKNCYAVKFGPQIRSSDVEHKIIGKFWEFCFMFEYIANYIFQTSLNEEI